MVSSKLTRRSGKEVFPSYTDGAALDFRDLLDSESGCGAWRIFELFANKGPFEVRLEWSAGDGAGQSAKVTVSRATRLSIFASTFTVRTANLTGVENRIGCNVSDGYAVSSNQFEVRLTGGETALAVDIPPFATHVRVDCADRTQLSSIIISALDGVALVRSQVAGNVQPDAGLPLGGARSLSISVPSALRVRVVFTLSI